MIIIKEKYGRLANRLWQFAYIVAFGRENNQTVSYPGFGDYADYFHGTYKNLFCSSPPLPVFSNKFFRETYYNFIPLLKRLLLRINWGGRWYRHIWVEPGQYFDLDSEENIKTLKSCYVVTIEGWLVRGNKSIVKHNEYIRSFFKPVFKYREPVDKICQSISKRHNIIIGMYIRRGEPKHRYEHGYYTFEEYKKILSRLNVLFFKLKPGFILTSDENIPKELFSDFSTYYTSDHPMEDLYALCSCDYICGISSTFGLWASFYGNVPLCIIDNIDQNISLDSFKIYKHLS